MKIPINTANTLTAATVASLLLAGCSGAPLRPEGADQVRGKLTQLQSDAQLASRAPVALKDAELAVRAAEKPQQERDKGEHLVFIADRKVDIAFALAESRLLIDQRKILQEERANMLLDSRTREADRARMEASAAQGQTDALRQQIAELNAKDTERGLVVTLGDLLFDTGKAELKSGATRNLTKLAVFLNTYKDRSVLIEGHTDNVGSEHSNLLLSQQRAESVKSWLENQGIASHRLVASGKGESSPVAGNESGSGRQLNRRVEVVIENPGEAAITR